MGSKKKPQKNPPPDAPKIVGVEAAIQVKDYRLFCYSSVLKGPTYTNSSSFWVESLSLQQALLLLSAFDGFRATAHAGAENAALSARHDATCLSVVPSTSCLVYKLIDEATVGDRVHTDRSRHHVCRV